MKDKLAEIGLRDRNGRMIHGGDKVLVRLWNGDSYEASVHYNQPNACWCIGERAIINLGRDRGTTFEVIEAPLPEAKPLKSRRKGGYSAP